MQHAGLAGPAQIGRAVAVMLNPSKPRTLGQIRRSVRVYAIMACLMFGLNVAALFMYYRLRNVETDSDVLKSAEVTVLGDTILFSGDISHASVERVKNYIDIDKKKEIQSFYLAKSNGGNAVAANDLVSILNERGVTVIFPYDSECNSSCVSLLVHAKSRDVQPTSGFGFHQGWMREQDWSIKGIYRFLVDGNWPKKAYYMDDWAREISPDFLTFLEGCSSKPLRNENALIVPWSVISKVANHTFPLTCDQGQKSYP